MVVIAEGFVSWAMGAGRLAGGRVRVAGWDPIAVVLASAEAVAGTLAVGTVAYAAAAEEIADLETGACFEPGSGREQPPRDRPIATSRPAVTRTFRSEVARKLVLRRSTREVLSRPDAPSDIASQ
jgi:hypothetical protein